MKPLKSIVLLACMAALQPVNSLASSAEIEDKNISALIEIAMERSQSQSETCQKAKRNIRNQCGQTYIFPQIAGHPEAMVADKINTFIKSLETKGQDNNERIESWTEVTLNKHNILSLSYTGQIYEQAASANRTIKTCANLDMVTGEIISLDEILKPGLEDELPSLIFENLQTRLKSKLPGYVHRLMTEKGDDWVIELDQAFLLNEHDLTLCYEHGALSEEAIGPIAIALPYSMLTGVIDETGLLAFALENNKTFEAHPPLVSPEMVAPPNPPTPSLANKPQAFIKNTIDGRRVGSVVHTCSKDNVTHTISVNEYGTDSPFICTVEYDKIYEQKTLWRSRKSKPFCHSNAEKLVSKYENTWGYTCGSVKNIPAN